MFSRSNKHVPKLTAYDGDALQKLDAGYGKQVGRRGVVVDGDWGRGVGRGLAQ